MTRIVVGIDGSEASIAALRWADDQARRSGALLELVHVYTTASSYAFAGGGLPAIVPCDDERLKLSASKVLNRALLVAEPRTPEVRLTVVDDTSPAHALGRVADGASMLVLGAHRHHGLGVLLGSTATSCVRNAGCPVVVVPTTTAVSGRRAAAARR